MIDQATSSRTEPGGTFTDPSLVLALVTGAVLTGFLLVAHSCCLGLTDQHLGALLQICSPAN